LAKEGLIVSRETLRKWMTQASFWRPCRQRVKKIYVWRERRQRPVGSIQSLNYLHKPGYAGMGAPAPGPYHHYTFELFALDTYTAGRYSYR
jgi:hypothetical protein